MGRFISSKSPALLSYLAYTGQPHTRAALTGLLWGDSPESQAKASLRQVLSDLRSNLSPYLIVEGSTVAFNRAAPHWLDVAEFNRHLQAAAPSDPNTDIALTDSQAAELQAAADLYRGDFLAGFFVPSAPTFEEWVTGEQEWLRQAVLQALHRLILHYTQRGAYLMGINAATRLLTLEPWQEEAHRQLMRLLALNGQRGAALAQYELCRRVLAKELKVSPTPTTTALYEAIRSGQIGPGQAAGILDLAPPIPHNLPDQTTNFIGRQTELAEIVAYLGDHNCRAITITGASGNGKTRLALAAADEVKRRYPQGIWYVPLTGIFANDYADDPALTGVSNRFGPPPPANGLAGQMVVDEIANAMKLSFTYHADPARQLIEHLRNKKVLLFLDGLKPALSPITDFLTRLLTEAGGVTLLVTAASPVGLPGEHTLALSGLPTPESLDGTHVEDYASVRLFIERADRAAGGFRPAPQDLPAIARICRLLAGNPLGIELAAAWVEHWAPPEILVELNATTQRELASTSQEARSPELVREVDPAAVAVEAAFQGCWDLLAPAERSTLALLTVFRGDFSEHAAEAITGATSAILAGLAERLLLQTPAPGRYAMHRLIHRFTLNRLPGPEATDDRSVLAADRHSGYYLGLLAQREELLQRRGMVKAVAEIQTEYRHIRQAWHWAASRGDIERLQRTANVLARYLSLRGLYQAGERLFGQAAEAIRARFDSEAGAQGVMGLVAELMRGQLLLGQARFLNLQADHARLAAVAQAARSQFEQTLHHAREERIRELAVTSLSNLGSIAVLESDYGAARDYLEAALQLYEQMDEPLIEANLLSDLGVVLMLYGDYAAARSYLERSQQTCRQNGNRAGEAMACYNLGRVTDTVGLYDEAQTHFEQALRISRGLGDERLEAQALTGKALLAHHVGDHNAAWETSHQAAQLAESTSNRPGQAEALTVSGHALLSLGMTAEAATAYGRALAIYRALGQRVPALEPLAGLAQAALAQDKLSQATGYADQILQYLIPPKERQIHLTCLQGTREPFRVCLACIQVLRATRNLRARDCEESAYHLLKEQADRISDPAMRRSFMRQVPTHHAIVEVHRANRATPWR